MEVFRGGCNFSQSSGIRREGHFISPQPRGEGGYGHKNNAIAHYSQLSHGDHTSQTQPPPISDHSVNNQFVFSQILFQKLSCN